MEKGLDFWDILMLVGALLILFWAILKAFGIITSPIWIEMVPYFGAGVALLGAVYKFGKMARRIEDTERVVHIIADRLYNLDGRFNKVENEHNLCLAGKLKVKH